MKKEFVFCEHCARNVSTELFETSADISEYCASGHFFQPTLTSTDGRPRRVVKSVNVERNEAKDIIAEDRTQIRNGGDYDFIAYKVIRPALTEEVS